MRVRIFQQVLVSNVRTNVWEEPWSTSLWPLFASTRTSMDLMPIIPPAATWWPGDDSINTSRRHARGVPWHGFPKFNGFNGFDGFKLKSWPLIQHSVQLFASHVASESWHFKLCMIFYHELWVFSGEPMAMDNSFQILEIKHLGDFHSMSFPIATL